MQYMRFWLAQATAVNPTHSRERFYEAAMGIVVVACLAAWHPGVP